MSRCMIYRGYTISSSPTKNDETDQWQLRISITWARDGGTGTRPYLTSMGYPTELEADLHGVAFAQRIIDGKVPGVSIGE